MSVVVLAVVSVIGVAGAADDDLILFDRDLDRAVSRPVFGIHGVVVQSEKVSAYRISPAVHAAPRDLVYDDARIVHLEDSRRKSFARHGRIFEMFEHSPKKRPLSNETLEFGLPHCG